jgi:hypothetical protein
MKTKPTPATNYKNTRKLFEKIVLLVLILLSLNGFSQVSNKPESLNQGKTGLTTLQDYVAGIRERNASIKNAEHINVMVNDLLIENLQEFTIDPKSIAAVEVLVLEPKAGSTQRTNPSIIINTRKK